MPYLYIIARIIVSPIFKTFMLAWRPIGKKNLPKGGMIFAANHTSAADGVLMNSHMYRPVRFLAKEELFATPFKRFIMKGIAQVPLKRGSSDMIAFSKAIEHLHKGDIIGIFPEGTRGDGKTLQRPHTGVIRLALLADVPIIPVGISGAKKAWPKGRYFPRFGKKVIVRYGEPWVVPKPVGKNEYSYEELRSLSQQLMDEKIRPLVDLE
ncbi:MAG: 1-acyl-sn-glycerol-3-phosphate acyltransferase [Thermoplasmata archaeon]|nr:1-acyl-sn-glycerol-3-phosphate acyltransferase [Thermoplasmata archaeon]